MAIARQRTHLIVVLALLAGCGEDRKPDPKQREAERVCREIAESFEENREVGFIGIEDVDFFAPALAEQATRLERVAPSAATYRGAAEDLAAATGERDLRGVRAAAQALRAASLPAAKAIGCELPPTPADVERLTMPFWGYMVHDSSFSVRGATRAMYKPGGVFLDELDRTVRALDRTVALLKSHEVPRPLRRVVARYFASMRAYRASLQRARRAIVAGAGEREVRRLLLAADRAFQRWEGAQTDVQHLV